MIAPIRQWWLKLLPPRVVPQQIATVGINQQTPKSRRAARHLKIHPFQQEFAYSCVAAVVQTIYHYHTGKLLSHEETIGLTGCHPEGAQLRTAAVVLKRLCGIHYRDVRTLAAAKKVLRGGMFIISNDEATWMDPHAVLFVGATNSGVYVYDPNTAQIKWRTDSFVRASGANEFIAIFASADLSACCKPAGKRQKSARIGKEAPPAPNSA